MSDEKKSKNRPKFVRFDPSYVGMDAGLDKAIEDARGMHVPLAVVGHELLETIKKKFPVDDVILIEDSELSTNPAQDEFNADREKMSGERRMKMDRTQEAMEEYRKFVMSMASAADKGKYEQIQQGCIGMCTETGELLDNLKKSMYQGRDFDVVNAKEECGDMLFYMTELLDAIDSDIFECIRLNTKKLVARYDDGKFNKDRSLNRDTDKERKVLEGGDTDTFQFTTCKKCPVENCDADCTEVCDAYVKAGRKVTFQNCSDCAVTDCGITREDGAICLLFKDNRNYPIQVSSSTAPTQQYSSDGRTPRCDNCAVCLQLGGCSRFIVGQEGNCCKDHKFL